MSCRRRSWIGGTLRDSDSPVRTSVFGGTIRRRHDLPFPGEILVSAGEEIEAGAPWAVRNPAGRVSIRDISRVSKVPPARVLDETNQIQNREIPPGTVIAAGSGVSTLFGGGDWVAPWNGKLAHASTLSGLGFFQQSIGSTALFARLSGVVVEVADRSHIVIEGSATSIRCAYGAGGTSFGRIRNVVDHAPLDFLADDADGMWIVVVAETVSMDWIDALPSEQIAAVVAPSTSVETFSQGPNDPENGGSSTAQPRIPIMLTEGVCSARMPPALQRIFRQHQGRSASVVAASTPGEAEVLLIGGNLAAGAKRMAAMRVAAGPDLGAQVNQGESEALYRRNGAGVLGRLVDLHREEGGRTQVIADNLERLG